SAAASGWGSDAEARTPRRAAFAAGCETAWPRADNSQAALLLSKKRKTVASWDFRLPARTLGPLGLSHPKTAALVHHNKFAWAMSQMGQLRLTRRRPHAHARSLGPESGPLYPVASGPRLAVTPAMLRPSRSATSTPLE